MAKDPSRILVPPHLDGEGRLATVQFRAMGTTVEIALVPEGYPWVVIEECLREAVNRCFEHEQRFSRFLPASEVSFMDRIWYPRIIRRDYPDCDFHVETENWGACHFVVGTYDEGSESPWEHPY